jgi:hypothetical protein
MIDPQDDIQVAWGSGDAMYRTIKIGGGFRPPQLITESVGSTSETRCGVDSEGSTHLAWSTAGDEGSIWYVKAFGKPTGPAPAFYFAEGTCRPGFDPYICIQNPGDTDAAVTISYMKGDGNTDIQDVTVPKNSRSTVIVKNKLGEADDPAHDFSCKVECTNGQSIVAERPMYFNYRGAWDGGHDVVGFVP